MTSRTMRWALEVVSLSALVIAAFATVNALYGPNPIPAAEPMTNVLSSHERDWGTRARLIEIPAFMLLVYVSLLLLARYSHLLSLPVQVTAENYGRVQTLVKSMISWLKAEALIMFGWLQIIQIQIARDTRSRIPIPAFQALTVVIFATSLIHYIAIRRQAPTQQDSTS